MDQDVILRTIFGIFLCLALAYRQTTATAQTAALSVDDAVALALRNNPLPQAAARQVGAARAGVSAARSLANPDVVVTPTVLGPMGADQAVSITQPLEVNGTRGA